MPTQRKCGIICHPTSMPGRFGIGELGEAACRFIDFLARAGQSIWQILPLGPTSYGDSPYQPFSAFAGNPLLIDLQQLVEEGLLSEEDVALETPFPEGRVLYGRVMEFKNRVLRVSYRNYAHQGSRRLGNELDAFCEEQNGWLADYALFMALKQRFDWAAWTDWDSDIALREDKAVAKWRHALRDEVDYQCYLQFQFSRQWERVRRYANDAGITIIGDVPIFVGQDSADVWSRRELFQLDQQGRPTVVAGVPPDYFSTTGQLWGNPLYRWQVMREDHYGWWMARLEAILSKVDLVRLDHFRGFAGYWEVSVGEKTAINGRWVKGPGEDFFRRVLDKFGELPIIAEDLGLISEDVIALRKAYGLPGMKVLQFAFGSDASNPYLPHNYKRDCVAYTATHDNDTTVGWYAAADEEIMCKVRAYAGTDGKAINWTFIRMVMNSVADTAVYPLQDVLGLGSEARLNQPGRSDGNWTWRYREDALSESLADTLREMAILSRRWLEPGQKLEAGVPTQLEYEEP